MTDEISVRLAQDQETPITVHQRNIFGYRFAYSRSADSRIHEDKGQDYLTFRENGQKLAFVLCDGVSQSFYGDLAAQLLGDELIEWLWKQPAPVSELVQNDLELFLDSLTKKSSRKICAYQIPEELAPMVRQVLEQKRSVGSESTFAAGMFNFDSRQHFLAWMGDSRLRLWGSEGEITNRLGDNFHTAERWSTNRGRIGNLHTYLIPHNELRYLIAYSDGLAQLDIVMKQHFPDASISTIIDETLVRPESDDISYFELWIGNRYPVASSPFPSPKNARLEYENGRARLVWRPVTGAAYYEVSLDDGKSFSVNNPGHSFDFSKELLASGASRIRVRAWDEEPGEWSAECLIPREVYEQATSSSDIISTQTHAIETVTLQPELSMTREPAPMQKPTVDSYPQNSILRKRVLSGVVVFFFLCALALGIFLPASPFRSVFLPAMFTVSNIEELPSSLILPTPLQPDATLSLFTEPIITEPLNPAIETPFPIIQATTLAQETATFEMLTEIMPTLTSVSISEPTGLSQSLCAKSIIQDSEIVDNPLLQKPAQGHTIEIGVCLSFDGWSDKNGYDSYWLRIAPAQAGFEDLAGKWILANRLNAPENTENLNIPRIDPEQIITPTSYPNEDPNSIPSPFSISTP